MPKRKRAAAPNPSRETLDLLEAVRGMMDANDPQVAQTARQFLSLPQEEQVAAAIWMGQRSEYAGMLAYLVARASVTGALRRAVKQAFFAMRRSGVQVLVSAEERPPLQEAATVSKAWMVEECFAAAPYFRPDGVFPLHLRFFMRHVSGQQAAFHLLITPQGHLYSARMVEKGVRELYEECVRNPYRLGNVLEAGSAKNEFIAVPIEWAVRIANEFRQRNVNDHMTMPPHAAFYWGRLPEPTEQPATHPVDSVPDAETGWLVTSLVHSEPPVPLTVRTIQMLMPYVPTPEEFASELDAVWKESQTRIILSPQSEEERKQQVVEKLHQRLLPDEQMREALVFMLPILGSVALLAGERDTARWLKALWRELKERPDRPLWRTEIAHILVSSSYYTLMAAVGKPPQEDRGDVAQSPAE